MASNNENAAYVLLNGKPIGRVVDPLAFVKEVISFRRKGLIPNSINVAYIKKLNEVHINADRGRVRKPYIVVENGKSLLTPELKEKLKRKEISFNYLLLHGIIEYLDAEEESNAVVALREEDITKDTTHLEVDGASIFGLTMNLTTFNEHNTVAKHHLGANFIKQAQGVYALNYSKRFDSRAFLLYYPQRPLIDTAAYRKLNLEKHASGQNFVVALTTYFGYNMMDAVVLNKAAVERGLARSAFFKSYIAEERRYPGGQKERFAIPPPTAEGYLGESVYSKLSDDGIIEKEMDVKEGEAIIGKLSPPRFAEEPSISGGTPIEKHKDSSIVLKPNEDGVVDEVLFTETLSATKLVKVRVRSIKIPELGDKFGSRHGQKGVVGLIVPQEDMPFTKDGIIPDMLLNPLSLPSRMTLSHLLETLAGKAASYSGRTIDETPFTEKNGYEKVKDYEEILKRYGFNDMGNEVMYDGRTGKPFESKIFIGVVYYNRLWHMSSLKLQVRSTGPVQLLTRQPTEGKPRRGGLRFGEMERDALVGHGASMLLKDRMLDQSDKTEVWICKKCGNLAYYDYIKRQPTCYIDGPGDFVVSVEMSYAFKLLLEEIKAMHILTTIHINTE
ncbi:MAG: DNA-directed RNA polymerase subunit B' [Candidatus Micrarchaeota archaeon]|nr:MAG: DNA-directed RNA polymerase subunit B' [Candidatus Micrarchaeota archaeon]